MWRDSSFCRRMLPTCGPLPCATTTSWPALTRSARRALVASIRFRWARTSEGSPGGKSALPPTATTSFVTQRLRGRPVHFGQSIRRFGRGNGPRERAPPGERHIYLSAARIAARCEPRGAPGLLQEVVPEVPGHPLFPDHVSAPARGRGRPTIRPYSEHRLLPRRPPDPHQHLRRPVLARRAEAEAIRGECARGLSRRHPPCRWDVDASSSRARPVVGAAELPGHREPDHGAREWIGRTVPCAALDVVRC